MKHYFVKGFRSLADAARFLLPDDTVIFMRKIPDDEVSISKMEFYEALIYGPVRD